MNLPIDKLITMPLFSGIDKNDIHSMLVCLNGFTRNYHKGEFIFLPEDPIKYLGVIINGTIHMIKEDFWGNKVILSIMAEMELFGETFSYSRPVSSTMSFYAAADVYVLFLPFERIMHSCSMSCSFHHRLIENMVILIAGKNAALLERLEVASKKNLRDKILSFLSIQAQNHNSKYFEIHMGRIELADYLCVDRSALTRELSRMRDDGLIDYEKNTFRLLK